MMRAVAGKEQQTVNTAARKCSVLGCTDEPDYAFEEPMFRTEIGAASPYRNHTLIWCRRHGRYFEAERRLQRRMLGKARS